MDENTEPYPYRQVRGNKHTLSSLGMHRVMTVAYLALKLITRHDTYKYIPTWSCYATHRLYISYVALLRS